MSHKTNKKLLKSRSNPKKTKKKSTPSKSKNSKKYNTKSYVETRDENPRVADFHVHSNGSSDGYHDVSKLLGRAKHFNIDYISITDHNNFNETLKLLYSREADLRLAMHDIDGVNFVPGVEITCRVNDVKNFKGNDLKVHLLVYAPTLTENSYLRKLMKIKHGNDLAVDFGLLINIAKVKGIQLDQDSIRDFVISKRKHGDSGFSSFGKDDVIDYFKKEKINICKSARAFTNLFDTLPRAERLNLSAEDVINLAHASGGICVMAHPKIHLNRTNNRKEAIDSLLEYGIDGFELMTNSMDSETFSLITGECNRFNSKNNILYTGGSDFHVYSEHSKLGRFGEDYPITLKSQEPVIKELKLLSKAREQKALTHRSYKMPIQSDLDGVVKKYSDKAHEINEFYTEAQKAVGYIEDEESFAQSDMGYVDYLRENGIYDEGITKK